MVLLIVDQSKWTDTTRFKTKVLEHTFWRCKRKFSWGVLARCKERCLESLLQVVNSKVVIAMEANKIVLITFVITHEDILAMHAAIIFPPTLRLLDGLAFGMVVAGEWDMVFSEITEYFFLSFHDSLEFCDYFA